VIEAEPGPDRVEYRELLDRFLAERAERTRQAYTKDLMEFGRFCGREPAKAVAALLAGGPKEARRLLAEYVVELRRGNLARRASIAGFPRCVRWRGWPVRSV
jgi:hypothetical protein